MDRNPGIPNLDSEDLDTLEPLRTRTAVVTGASSGIGRAVALRLAQEGAFLHLVGRDETRLKETAQAAREAGGEADVHTADFEREEDIGALAEQLEKEVRAVDILVHSAGVVSLGPLADAPLEDLDWHYLVNVRAPYSLTQKLLPLLQRAKGQIVFINSGAGLNAKGTWSQYAMSKHALKALADSLRDEVAGDGMRVLSVYPGRTHSPMQRAVREMEGQDYDPESFIQPDDVAQTVVSALELPRSAHLTELVIRPGR